MKRLLVVVLLALSIGVGATADSDAGLDVVHAVGLSQIQTPLAHPGITDDICRYIIAAGHPRDIVRTHYTTDGNHVRCEWWHMIPTGPSSWGPSGKCHQGDYFINSGNYYPGPIFNC